MRVKFKKEWYGSLPGSIEDVAESFARGDLIPRGIVEPAEDEKAKQVKAAPKDKMVKGATKTK